MTDRTILIVGTYDTKDDELSYMAEVIRGQGGGVRTMDVSVLGDPSEPCDVSKHEVAAAAGKTIAAAASSKDENAAMRIMADGAARIAAREEAEGRVHGVVALGGTMGTDLALDVAAALPMGVPKYVVSTVSFSPMVPPERIAPDLQMILWAGGLFGLNSICRASLGQAAGAVLGAARAVERPGAGRPRIGMTSFGKTVLTYMVGLKPALEARGFEVAVFHATGMGGRAFEGLAADGAFAAVMDFAPQEAANHAFGSAITAGPDRMTAAGRRGTPQMVAPGCCDLVDFVGWMPVPPQLRGREIHAHNRLLSSALLNPEERIEVARLMKEKLAVARGPVTLFLPKGGCHEWDRPGGPLSDPVGLEAFMTEMETDLPTGVVLRTLDAHINDAAFVDAVVAEFDRWIAEGVVPC